MFDFDFDSFPPIISSYIISVNFGWRWWCLLHAVMNNDDVKKRRSGWCVPVPAAAAADAADGDVIQPKSFLLKNDDDDDDNGERPLFCCCNRTSLPWWHADVARSCYCYCYCYCCVRAFFGPLFLPYVISKTKALSMLWCGRIDKDLIWSHHHSIIVYYCFCYCYCYCYCCQEFPVSSELIWCYDLCDTVIELIFVNHYWMSCLLPNLYFAPWFLSSSSRAALPKFYLVGHITTRLNFSETHRSYLWVWTLIRRTEHDVDIYTAEILLASLTRVIWRRNIAQYNGWSIQQVLFSKLYVHVQPYVYFFLDVCCTVCWMLHSTTVVVVVKNGNGALILEYIYIYIYIHLIITKTRYEKKKKLTTTQGI